MKQTPKMLSLLCTLSADAMGANDTARKAPVGRTTLYRWLQESRERPEAPEFLHSWPEDAEPAPFYKNFSLSQRMAQANLRFKIMELSLHPQKTPIHFQGRTVYALNPEWIKAGGEDDLALCKILGIEKYLTDEAGNLVPEMETSAINAQIILAAVRAFDKRFRDESDVNVKHSGGVLIVGGQAAPQKRVVHDVTPAPKMVDHRPTPTVVGVIDAMAEPIAEAIAEADADDAVDVTQVAPIISGRDIHANNLRAELETRAAALAARGPANPTPGKYVSMAERRAMGLKAPPAPTPNTDLDDKSGHGAPLAGGVKVR